MPCELLRLLGVSQSSHGVPLAQAQNSNIVAASFRRRLQPGTC